jgi:hypothetical protein
MFTVVVSNLVVKGLTLAQLDTFLTAGIAAVPGAELVTVEVTVTQDNAVTSPAPAPAG